RRYAAFTDNYLAPLIPVHKFITIAALFTGAAQLLFLCNVIWSRFRGPKATDNPWEATTLEWSTSSPPPFDNFGGRHLVLQHGRPAPVSTFPAAVRPSQTGIGVALAAISMMFAALTSAMVVRQGAARDWGHFELPGILYFNTLILLLSSFSLELARRRFAQDPGLGREESHGNAGQSAQVLYWLYATM